ncbi:hypothetical protein OHA84_01400 [Streptomyces sp. NBC_00513]|uniref:hypothetical protein n=1 Tax=unclassified Streptomyces TaxID=2593676 RepID=UPI002254BDE4|nr:hypothetical protein [Streptomyces sp. NBC_00424]MCX5079360.1 hypothetical protein [Streptomyces sp. NBC_00424]WUD39262.1 hypothetical protein OHA84_01400 [Streptomyces sp. NBC_00513]
MLLTALRLLQERGERVTVPALALVCAEIEGSDLPAARSAKPFSSVPIALAKVHRRAEAVEGLDIEALSKLAPAADDVFEEIAAGYEEAVKRFRAAKKQAAAERKKREKSSAKARGRKRGRGRGEGQGSVPAGYVSFPDGATTRRTPS